MTRARGVPCCSQETKWTVFTQYCADRVKELEAVKAESTTHALHDDYTLNRLFQRFDGLFEKEWAKVQSMDFESTLEVADTTEELPEAEKTVMRAQIASLTGLPATAFGEEK